MEEEIKDFESCNFLDFKGKFDEAAKIAQTRFWSATDRGRKLIFLSKWAEIAFQNFDIKCLTHEIYPVIENEMAAIKDDQVVELL